MINKIVFISALIFILFPPLSEGADWLHFIQNKGGENRYIDIETIKQTSPHTFEAVQKVEPHNSPDTAYILSRLEVDCSGRRIRVLEETVYTAQGEARKTGGHGEFKEVRANDVEESLLELLCSLKKTAR
jgi:hypothetical protein